MAPVIDNDRRLLIAHIVFRFDYGGLENGVVNIINGLPEGRFRHAVVSLTEAGAFRERIKRSDVTFFELHKRPGQDVGMLARLYRLLRQLKPAIVHTRNVGTLESAIIARIAGVPACIHGEHGWDTYDPDGNRFSYRVLRLVANPLITRFMVVSRELEQWLTGRIGIPPRKVQRICNGVDTEKFRPGVPGDRKLVPPEFRAPELVLVGCVTRFSDIKDPLGLVRAFAAAWSRPEGQRLRLVMVGDGALLPAARQLATDCGCAGAVWLPGSREDVAPLMREMSLYALPSLREGISNTILEAMATGLPVVASATGGNLELVVDNVTGRLVPTANHAAMADALLAYAKDPEMLSAHGTAARTIAVKDLSLHRMLSEYESLYQSCCVKTREAA